LWLYYIDAAREKKFVWLESGGNMLHMRFFAEEKNKNPFPGNA
jgi:hypothetical protein